MRLNQIEWAQAQDLLVRLAQVLTPLTESPSVCRDLDLANRLFTPSSKGPVPPSHSFRLLTTLQLASTEMGKLIQKLPEKENTSASDQKPVWSENTNSARPLSSQAKKLVWQVRESIRFLSSGGNLSEPKSAPLRETFSHLKPLIDEFIRGISQSQIKFSDHPRPAVAKSSRETLLIKERTSVTSGLAAPYLSASLNFVSSKRKKRKEKDSRSKSDDEDSKS